jgi:hypothetical protein
MRKSTMLMALLGFVLLLLGAAFVLSLDAKPNVSLVEKVFPDERFAR